MKTYNNKVREKELILFRINLLEGDSLRILLKAGNLGEMTDEELAQFVLEAKHLRKNLTAVGQSILHIYRGPEEDASVLIHVRDEVVNKLHRIKSTLEGIQDPRSSLYN